MRPLELAQKYMEIFFSGDNVEELSKLLANDFSFRGPFYDFDTAEDYIKALQSDPPKGFAYKIISSFENDSSACLVYQFVKPGVCEPMAQMFETSHGKITKILLIFDTGAFTLASTS